MQLQIDFLKLIFTKALEVIFLEIYLFFHLKYPKEPKDDQLRYVLQNQINN